MHGAHYLELCAAPAVSHLRSATMAMRAIKSKSMGRLQLLEWLNAFLEADYSRVEHLKDGIAFAQILDAVNPGKVCADVRWLCLGHAPLAYLVCGNVGW